MQLKGITCKRRAIYNQRMLNSSIVCWKKGTKKMTGIGYKDTFRTRRRERERERERERVREREGGVQRE